MAVTIAALTAAVPGSTDSTAIDNARFDALRRPGGFVVPVARDVVFAGWWSDPNAGTADGQSITSAEGGSCSTAAGPRVSVICDARIDNALDLRHQLGIGRSGSTADLLGQAYLRWGDRLCERLYGDFAAMIWDPKSRVLHLMRDHIGAKPLYFAQRPGRWLAACSDVAFLVEHGLASRDIDEIALGRFLARTLTEDHRTFFSDVSRVPSATVVAASQTSWTSSRYWHLEPGERLRFTSRRDCLDQFDDVLTRSITNRLGDRPVAAHLSGGLDSTGIAVIAAQQLAASGETLITGSLTSRPSESDAYPTEMPFIRAALDWLDVEGHVIVDSSPLGVSNHRLPSRPAMYPCGPGEVVLRRLMAARGVHTMLSGWGGDEVVTSTVGWRSLVRDRCWRSAHREARDRLGSGVPALLRPALPVGWHRPAHPRPAREALIGNDAVVGPWLRAIGVSERLSALILSAEPRQSRPTDHRDHMRQRVEHGHLQQRIELWAEADRRYGMECAYPLLDRELLEFVVSLPADQLRWAGHARSLMRDVLDGRMSDEVRRRRDKTGAVSDLDGRWAGTPEAHARTWARSELLRTYIDPDLLVAGTHEMVTAQAGAPPTPPERLELRTMRPLVSRLVMAADFLAAVDGVTTPDDAESMPQLHPVSEAR